MLATPIEKRQRNQRRDGARLKDELNEAAKRFIERELDRFGGGPRAGQVWVEGSSILVCRAINRCLWTASVVSG
jgi:hypothetical protein